jgi:hypothetical protein
LRAIHPVVATIIIVSVAIAIGIAVALWITGSVYSYRGVEEIKVVNTHVDCLADSEGNTYWVVHIIIKNTGTKPATVDQLFINDFPGDINNINYTRLTGTHVSGSGEFTINPGEEYELAFYLNSLGSHLKSPVNKVFISGETINIVIHTASGGRYYTTLQLP